MLTEALKSFEGAQTLLRLIQGYRSLKQFLKRKKEKKQPCPAIWMDGLLLSDH